jgi:hypothetical protein
MALKAVMDRSNDPTIGSDIASIIIELSKKRGWFSRLLSAQKTNEVASAQRQIRRRPGDSAR